MKNVTYIRCPRCELNYIDKKEKFCSVCKQEMQVGGGEDFDELDLELCPICKTNYIQPDEVMCASCLAERANDPDYDPNSDDDWSAYLNRDENEELDDGQDDDLGDLSTVDGLGIDDDDDDTSDLDLDDDLDNMPDDLDDDDDKDDDKFEDEEDEDDDYDDYEDEEDDDEE